MAVVLLHGFLENSSMWNELLPLLTLKYKVITIDLLGHGNTDSVGYIHTMEDQADMIYAVLKELHIKKAVFIGHSMGGYVSLAFAEHFTEMIKGILLMNSTANADSLEKKENRTRAIKAVKENFNTFINLSITNLFSEENRDTFKSEIQMVKNEALKTSLQGVIAALEGMKIRKDREILLHTASYPIKLILGKKDGVLSYEAAINQVNHTNVELVSLSGGHMSHIENKAELFSEILSFLKRI